MSGSGTAVSRRALGLLAGLAALLPLLGAAWATAAEPKVVRVGIAAEPYPPFTSQDASGKWVGFEVDLLNAVCAAEHLTCTIVGSAYDGIFAALNANKIDVVWTSVGITDKRKEVLDFTDKYYDTPAAVIARKSDAMKLSVGDFAALKGKTVGVQTTTIYADFLAKYLPGQVNMKTYDTQDNANADLSAGRLDAVIADAVVLGEFLKTEQASDLEVKLSIPASFDRSVFGYGVGAGVRKSDGELRQTLNDGIRKVRADGTYDRLAKQYFSFDVYGK